MSPQAIARVVAAAREFCAAEIRYDEDRLGHDWRAAHIRLDHARMELRAACGYEAER